MQENYGVLAVRGPAGPRSPVVVLGVPRGGTSMIAAALIALGVDMGEPARGNMEDRAFRRMWTTGKGIDAFVAGKRAEGGRWGVKVPTMIKELDRVEKVFPDAAFILVMRDPAAVAFRGAMAEDLGPERLLGRVQRVAALYDGASAFLMRSGRPALLVSHAKAQAHPAEFVKALADFLGITGFSAEDVVARIADAHRSYTTRADEDRASRMTSPS